MKTLTARLIECFGHVFAAEHYYWTHTDGDAGGRISVENLQRVIERMTGKKIVKRLVNFPGTLVRGNFERYDDHFEINVRKAQPDDWIRFTAVKEMSHALNDQPSEYSTAGVQTIKELVLSDGILSDDMSEQVRSERLAELFAVELIYPFNYRKEDVALLSNGTSSIRDIAKQRGVPLPITQRHLQAAPMKTCGEVWDALGSAVKAAGVKLPPLRDD